MNVLRGALDTLNQFRIFPYYCCIGFREEPEITRYQSHSAMQRARWSSPQPIGPCGGPLSSHCNFDPTSQRHSPKRTLRMASGLAR